MSNVIAFPELPPKSTNRAGANVCAQGSAAGGVLVDLAAVRAEESNWIYGRWDIRELPVDMEDWPQELLILMANDHASEREWDRMVAEDEAAHHKERGSYCNVVELAAVRADRSNCLYGRWDIRQLPTFIEDWPQALLERVAAEWQSKDPFGDMLADHDSAMRAELHVVR
ncbi:MAG: hypothetical protein EPN36_14545 [Rhodanobacteraceae bacterium]|nr:MAG: hypothetical protein EPN36_14545 [Rhodanobacteraceae bacterium]